jgi:hypothetical protein
MENAEVTGDIRAAVLSMEAGAVLIGCSAVGAVPSEEEPRRERETDRSEAPPEYSPAREERELAHA